MPMRIADSERMPKGEQEVAAMEYGGASSDVAVPTAPLLPEKWALVPDRWSCNVAATLCEWALALGLLAWQSGGAPLAALQLVPQRAAAALTRMPTIPDWSAVLVVLLSAAAGAALGFRTGFLRCPAWPEPQRRWQACLGIFTTFFCPGLVEELWFRAVLLRDPMEATKAPAVVLDNCVALLAFVVYHIDVIHTNAMFRDGRFLFLSFCMGVAMTALYTGVGGSIWPPAFVHGLLVWAWLFCAGGNELAACSPASRE